MAIDLPIQWIREFLVIFMTDVAQTSWTLLYDSQLFGELISAFTIDK